MCNLHLNNFPCRLFANWKNIVTMSFYNVWIKLSMLKERISLWWGFINYPHLLFDKPTKLKYLLISFLLWLTVSSTWLTTVSNYVTKYSKFSKATKCRMCHWDIICAYCADISWMSVFYLGFQAHLYSYLCACGLLSSSRPQVFDRVHMQRLAVAK